MKLSMSILLSMLLLGTTAAQAKNGFYPTNFNQDFRTLSSESNDAAAGKLVYYGGPVISNAKIYVVFWGPNVNASIKTGMGGFYSTVTNSSYMDWLDEYNTFSNGLDGRGGTKQHIGRGKFAGAITINPFNTSTSIDDVDIQAEIQKQIDAGKLPKADDNTLYMTYFPPGISLSASGMHSCQDFCAYHGFKGEPNTEHFFYGVMPDLGGMCSFGCGFASDMFSVSTAISSHEMVEAITDPFPTPGSSPAYPQAWNSTDGSEIGDLCAGTNNSVSAGAKTYTVQSQWDNSINACTSKNWTAP